MAASTPPYRIVYHAEPDPRRDDDAYTDHHVEAFHRAELVGYLIAFSRTDDPAWVQIGGMAVHPDHRRRGIATRLVDELAAREPGRLIRHGGRTAAGHKWWLACRRRPEFDRRRHSNGYRAPELDGYDWRDPSSVACSTAR
jgi:GNAT superfamily N-acetyltransferase